jgi:4-hydroxy-tetrahydrodipicolinate synthase
MNNNPLHGVIVPVITPIDDHEDVDEPAFRRALRRLVRAGVQGIFVGGSAGEGPLLTDRQWRRMMEIAFEEVALDPEPSSLTPDPLSVPALLGGAIDTSTRRVCDKVRALGAIGYRHFVVTPTFYLAAKTADEHLRLFGEAKQAGGSMEMLAYNIPQCTGAAIAVDTVCELAQRGWIGCCKESSGDRAYVMELIRRGKPLGLTVLAGDERTSDEALLAGAGGIVPVCANYDPGLFLRLYDAGSRGDREQLARAMDELRALHEALILSGPYWLSGIKYALAALGIGSGRVLSPLPQADAQAMAKIDARIERDRAALDASTQMPGDEGI